MKKKDLMLGAGVILLAFVMLVFMHFMNGKDGNQIKITVDGKLYGIYALNKNQVIEVKNGDFYNRIQIRDGKAYMEEANCPDGYCEQQGKIGGRTQTIVCLPHKLVVEVLDADGKETSDQQEDIPDTIAK